jgi:hypothetical protein
MKTRLLIIGGIPIIIGISLTPILSVYSIFIPIPIAILGFCIIGFGLLKFPLYKTVIISSVIIIVYLVIMYTIMVQSQALT